MKEKISRKKIDGILSQIDENINDYAFKITEVKANLRQKIDLKKAEKIKKKIIKL